MIQRNLQFNPQTVVYLESLSEGGGSVVFQTVPSSDEHLQAEGGAILTRLFMTLDQWSGQDLKSSKHDLLHNNISVFGRRCT